MADRRCCCGGDCFLFEDDFNRTASTNLGSDWNEVSGDWEIVDAGYGDLCLACPPPLCQLHEKTGETIGGGSNTSGAKVIGTRPVPSRSAGEMSIEVAVLNPQTGDVFKIYPCCLDTSTTGAVTCTYTYNGSNEWEVDINGTSKIIDGAPFSEGLEEGIVAFKLRACADHNEDTGMVWAWVYGFDAPLWVDGLDPGAGRYYGLGHANTDHGVVFDDFSITDLRYGIESCSECWCRCQGVPPTRHLYAEIHDATGRASCLNGVNWPMTYADGPSDPSPNCWQGISYLPNYTTPWPASPATTDVPWSLCCAAGDSNDPAWPGRNFSLDAPSGYCMDFDTTRQADASRSECNPLELWFGPYSLVSVDCSVCVHPGTAGTGTFWIVITEA